MNEFSIFSQGLCITLRFAEPGDLVGRLLDEAKNKDLGNGYTFIKHQAHTGGAEQHVHLDCRGTRVLSMNMGGSAHDGQGGRIPSKVFDKLRAALPDFTFPSNRIVEEVEARPNRGELEREIVAELRSLLATQAVVPPENTSADALIEEVRGIYPEEARHAEQRLHGTTEVDRILAELRRVLDGTRGPRT